MINHAFCEDKYRWLVLAVDHMPSVSLELSLWFMVPRPIKNAAVNCFAQIYKGEHWGSLCADITTLRAKISSAITRILQSRLHAVTTIDHRYPISHSRFCLLIPVKFDIYIGQLPIICSNPAMILSKFTWVCWWLSSVSSRNYSFCEC